MKVAVVGLNSLYACGATSVLLHLSHQSDWDLVSYTETEDELLRDIPLPDDLKVIRVGPKNVNEVLKKYDVLLFVFPRWEGNYKFLDKSLSKKITGVVIHDERDFVRLNTNHLIERFPGMKLFCFDYTIPELFRSYKFHVIKHPYNMNIFKEKPSIPRLDNTTFFVCATRVSPSKNIDKVIRLCDNYPLHIFGVKERNDLPKEFGSNVFIHYGLYTFEDVSKSYSSAIASIDASTLPHPVKRTQYAFMDAWRFSIPVLCYRSWIGDELIDKVNCLELTKENIKELWSDRDLCYEIGHNGYLTLISNHDPDDVRSDILNNLLGDKK